MADILDLSGRTALVTGASRGIGRAIAQELARRGASVALVARNNESLQAVAEELSTLGVQVITIVADLADPCQCRKAIAEANATFGGPDILVNNAGINYRKRSGAVTDGDWEAIMSLNLRAVFECSRAAATFMQQRGWGRIVNIGSSAGLVAVDTGTPYAASKAAVAGLTRSMAIEYAEHGICVNCVAPWYFRTPLTEPVLSDPELAARIIRRTPMRRPGELHELAAVVAFLCSEGASYLTGCTIPVDGGMTVFGFSPWMEC